MKTRGQGAFEYILMLAGVLLIVILIVLILQSNIGGINNNLGNTANTAANVIGTDVQKNDVVGLIARDPNVPLVRTDTNVAITGPLTTVPCSFNTGTARCAVGALNTLRPNCPSLYFNNKSGTC